MQLQGLKGLGAFMALDNAELAVAAVQERRTNNVRHHEDEKSTPRTSELESSKEDIHERARRTVSPCLKHEASASPL